MMMQVESGILNYMKVTIMLKEFNIMEYKKVILILVDMVMVNYLKDTMDVRRSMNDVRICCVALGVEPATTLLGVGTCVHPTW